jgi:hypothetical protein
MKMLKKVRNMGLRATSLVQAKKILRFIKEGNGLSSSNKRERVLNLKLIQGKLTGQVVVLKSDIQRTGKILVIIPRLRSEIIASGMAQIHRFPLRRIQLDGFVAEVKWNNGRKTYCPLSHLLKVSYSEGLVPIYS